MTDWASRVLKGSPNVQYVVGETANGGNKLFVLLISNLISDSLSMILFQALATTIGGQIPWHGQTESLNCVRPQCTRDLEQIYQLNAGHLRFQRLPATAKLDSIIFCNLGAQHISPSIIIIKPVIKEKAWAELHQNKCQTGDDTVL